MTHQALQRTATLASKLLAALSCGALFVTMILTFLDVIGRYGFNNSIFGASEMVELLMVAIVFGGFAFVTASDEHICVTLFDHLLVRRAPLLMGWIRFLFSLLVYLIFLWIFWAMAVEAWVNDGETIVLSLPLWLFSGMAAVILSMGIVLFMATRLKTPSDKSRSYHD